MTQNRGPGARHCAFSKDQSSTLRWPLSGLSARPPKPPPPRRQARHKLEPSAALRITPGRPQHGNRAPAPPGTLHPHVTLRRACALVSAVGELIAACAADGSMREGMNPEDVLLMMSFMTRVESTPAAAARADRAMELAINGLRQP